jgi:serine/threonine protein phosphatase 1
MMRGEDSGSAMSSEQGIFAALRSGRRVWAVSALHGEAGRLAALHSQIYDSFEPGDQIVYLGNYSGHGTPVRETIDELLLFRRAIMALSDRDEDCDNIVFLRGAQEEMWQKLLQLQFAPNPAQVLKWMVGQGIEPTINAYGASVEDALVASREGTLALTRWTTQLRQNLRSYDGHNALMSVLRHAAYTDDGAMLFVHAGIDPHRPLSAQSDSFWWGGSGFASMTEAYNGYQRVIRGFDRRRAGLQETDFTVSLDAGGGFGGPLLSALFAPDGAIIKTVSS